MKIPIDIFKELVRRQPNQILNLSGSSLPDEDKDDYDDVETDCIYTLDKNDSLISYLDPTLDESFFGDKNECVALYESELSHLIEILKDHPALYAFILL